MVFLIRISILLLVVGFVSGCAMGGNQAKDDNDNRGAEIQNVEDHNYNVGNENNQSRMQVADKAQSKIEDMEEIRHATVIVANRNAYIAVVQDNEEKGDLRRDLENKISDKVKEEDNDIRNVFVSSNPDFVDRMGDYGDKIESGQPVQGLFEEFTEMVQRVFPNAR